MDCNASCSCVFEWCLSVAPYDVRSSQTIPVLLSPVLSFTSFLFSLSQLPNLLEYTVSSGIHLGESKAKLYLAYLDKVSSVEYLG